MSYNIKLTRAAEEDLSSIFEYIAFSLGSPQNAVGQLSRLEQGVASLDHLPERFRLYEKEPWTSRGLRIMPVDNYLVFYIPDVMAETVTVLRILYGGRDTDRLFPNEL